MRYFKLTYFLSSVHVSYSHYRIRITGSLASKGFGFFCMHAAFKSNVTGSIFYESEHSAILEMTGNKEDILLVIESCRQEHFVRDVDILARSHSNSKLTDFIMLNQIDS